MASNGTEGSVQLLWEPRNCHQSGVRLRAASPDGKAPLAVEGPARSGSMNGGPPLLEKRSAWKHPLLGLPIPPGPPTLVTSISSKAQPPRHAAG